MALRFWQDTAPVIGRCPCGGQLRQVEDFGPVRPIEAQCTVCSELTGVPHDAVSSSPSTPTPTGVVPGSVQDFGF